MRYFAPFLTNTALQYQSATGLSALPQFQNGVIIQLEFVRTRYDPNGAPFTPDGSTPVEWLASKGVVPWLYLDVPTPRSLAVLGDSTRPPETNNYWFRRAQAREIEKRGWFFDGKGYPAAVNNRDYWKWTLDQVLAINHPRLYLDEYDLHRHYYNPEVVKHYVWFADQLIQNGRSVLANGGWQMDDPDLPPDLWSFPLFGAVDGVLIEHSAGLSRWGGGRGAWWGLTDDRIVQIAQAWRNLGAEVWLDAGYFTVNSDGSKHARASRFVDFDSHARHYHALAKQIGAVFATGRGDPGYTPTGQAWWLPWYESTPVVTPPPLPSDLETLRAQVETYRTEVAALRAEVLAVGANLQAASAAVDTVRNVMDEWRVRLRGLP